MSMLVIPLDTIDYALGGIEQYLPIGEFSTVPCSPSVRRLLIGARRPQAKEDRTPGYG
jgi:hypothetical protein